MVGNTDPANPFVVLHKYCDRESKARQSWLVLFGSLGGRQKSRTRWAIHLTFRCSTLERFCVKETWYSGRTQCTVDSAGCWVWVQEYCSLSRLCSCMWCLIYKDGDHLCFREILDEQRKPDASVFPRPLQILCLLLREMCIIGADPGRAKNMISRVQCILFMVLCLCLHLCDASV